MIEINYGFLEIEGNERYELHWFNPWESTLRITFNNAISYAKKKKTKTIVELKNYRFEWKILRIFCVVCLHLCHSLVGGIFRRKGINCILFTFIMFTQLFYLQSMRFAAHFHYRSFIVWLIVILLLLLCRIRIK